MKRFGETYCLHLQGIYFYQFCDPENYDIQI